MNLNQILAIILAVLGVLTISTAQLTDLFGAKLAHTIGALAGLISSILASVLAVITGNASMLKSVAALPGVDKVSINTQASAAVAAVAVDPQQPKVGATSAVDRPALQEIAKG